LQSHGLSGDCVIGNTLRISVLEQLRKLREMSTCPKCTVPVLSDKGEGSATAKLL
jgi:hypothetical protein